MASLIVNVDQVAALREVRKLREPDPAQVAVLAELAGADGIAVQLRRDRKYIRDRDLYVLREVVKTRLMVEMAPIDENIDKALEIKPWMVTFAADHADSDTPVSGIDFNTAPIDFGDIITRLKGARIGACFFVEPDIGAIKGARKTGATAIMINCGGFTEASTFEEAQSELDRIDSAAQAASKSDLSILAGRGINYKNVLPLYELNLVNEFVIGHSLSSRAILSGYSQAVQEMLRLITMPSPTG